MLWWILLKQVVCMALGCLTNGIASWLCILLHFLRKLGTVFHCSSIFLSLKWRERCISCKVRIILDKLSLISYCFMYQKLMNGWVVRHVVHRLPWNHLDKANNKVGFCMHCFLQDNPYHAKGTTINRVVKHQLKFCLQKAARNLPENQILLLAQTCPRGFWLK